MISYFVKISNNTCQDIYVVDNNVLENKTFPESEPLGVLFLKSLFGEDTEWKQTSLEGEFRGRYAGTGFVYDPQLDIFKPQNQLTEEAVTE